VTTRAMLMVSAGQATNIGRSASRGMAISSQSSFVITLADLQRGTRVSVPISCVSIRQHASVYVSIRQLFKGHSARQCLSPAAAYVSIRQHTSAIYKGHSARQCLFIREEKIVSNELYFWFWYQKTVMPKKEYIAARDLKDCLLNLPLETGKAKKEIRVF
jgi:hypothetical protein